MILVVEKCAKMCPPTGFGWLGMKAQPPPRWSSPPGKVGEWGGKAAPTGSESFSGEKTQNETENQRKQKQKTSKWETRFEGGRGGKRRPTGALELLRQALTGHPAAGEQTLLVETKRSPTPRRLVPTPKSDHPLWRAFTIPYVLFWLFRFFIRCRHANLGRCHIMCCLLT